jgi:hypothetical protein
MNTYKARKIMEEMKIIAKVDVPLYFYVTTSCYGNTLGKVGWGKDWIRAHSHSYPEDILYGNICMSEDNFKSRHCVKTIAHEVLHFSDKYGEIHDHENEPSMKYDFEVWKLVEEWKGMP